jgi:uroporphyrinogen-III synthase
MAKKMAEDAPRINRILVSQPRPPIPNSPFEVLAKKAGVEIVFEPFIHVEEVSANDFRKQRIDLAKFPSVIFTGRKAIEHYFRISEAVRFKVPDEMRYFCTSEAVALYLQKHITYRKRKIFFPEDGTLEALIKQMERYKDEKFLLPLSDVHTPEIPRELKKAGIKFSKTILYRTVSSDLQHVDINSFDMLVFYSPQGVKSLMANFPEFKQGSVCIAAFGKNTHRAVKAEGLKLEVPAPTTTFKSMTEALDDFLTKRNHLE